MSSRTSAGQTAALLMLMAGDNSRLAIEACFQWPKLCIPGHQIWLAAFVKSTGERRHVVIVQGGPKPEAQPYFISISDAPGQAYGVRLPLMQSGHRVGVMTGSQCGEYRCCVVVESSLASPCHTLRPCGRSQDDGRAWLFTYERVKVTMHSGNEPDEIRDEHDSTRLVTQLRKQTTSRKNRAPPARSCTSR
jgi:hypothetical protein